MDGDEAVAGTRGAGHPPDYAASEASRGLPRRPRLAASAVPAAARGAHLRDRPPRHETAESADGHFLGSTIVGRSRAGGPARGRFGGAPHDSAVTQPVLMVDRPPPDGDLDLGRTGAVPCRARCRHAGYATS